MASSKKIPTYVDIANKISEENDCDILFINAPIDRNTYNEVRTHMLMTSNKHKKLMFILVTYGGSLDDAYKIAKLIQNNYTQSTCCILGPCKSAGTLCACCADEIIVSDMGELGPLDVQILRFDDLGSRESGLVIKESLNQIQENSLKIFQRMSLELKSYGNISYSKASEIAIKIAQSIMSPICAQINPLRLGEYERHLQIAKEYGDRLNRKSCNMKEGALSKLISGYPHHAFVIDKDEAKTLFHHIRDLNELEKNMVNNIADRVLVPLEENNAMIFYINREIEKEEA